MRADKCFLTLSAGIFDANTCRSQVCLTCDTSWRRSNTIPRFHALAKITVGVHLSRFARVHVCCHVRISCRECGALHMSENPGTQQTLVAALLAAENTHLANSASIKQATTKILL